jgi:uncharacterized damage-inducible protein DinB
MRPVLFRVLRVALVLAAGAIAASAQAKPEEKPEGKKAAAGASSQAVKEANYMWKRAKKWSLEYVDAMPEGAVNSKPTPEVRSFAEQMLHLAFWNYGMCESLGGAASPYGTKQETIEKRDDLKTKAALRKFVEESYDYVLAAIARLDDAKLAEEVSFFGNKVSRRMILTLALDHQTHHRGQTTLYLRLKGVTPPPEPQP